MARIRIPPIDVPAIDPVTGRWNPDYYDIIKGLERLGLLDLADVSTTAPANLQVMIWNSTTGKFTPGAN
jgi:hypothetical protein